MIPEHSCADLSWVFLCLPSSSPSQMRCRSYEKGVGMSVYKIRVYIIISPAQVSPNLKPKSVPQIRPLPHASSRAFNWFHFHLSFCKTQHFKIPSPPPLANFHFMFLDSDNRNDQKIAFQEHFRLIIFH